MRSGAIPSFFMRVLIFLSLFGLLFLTGCGKEPVGVFDSKGSQVGSMDISGESAVIHKGETTVGTVESGTILGPDGKKMGSVVMKNDHVLIADITGAPVGSLEEETNCFGKTSAMLGHIGGKVEAQVAAGGCYLLLVAKQAR